MKTRRPPKTQTAFAAVKGYDNQLAIWTVAGNAKHCRELAGERYGPPLHRATPAERRAGWQTAKRNGWRIVKVEIVPLPKGRH